MVDLAGIVRKLTAPKPLELLFRLADVPARVDLSQARAVGPFVMIFALRDPQVKQGMGIVLELTKGLALARVEEPVAGQAATTLEPDGEEAPQD